MVSLRRSPCVYVIYSDVRLWPDTFRLTQLPVYIQYAKYSRISAVALYLVMIIASNASSIGASFWLKEWAEHNQEFGGNSQAGMYIGIYFAIGIGSSLLTMVQTLVLWIFCSIEASRKLHERMAIAIFRSPMSFFDTTPAGRILNRFSG